MKTSFSGYAARTLALALIIGSVPLAGQAPPDVAALVQSAREAGARKDWAKAAEAWEKVAELRKGPTAYYNAACSRARLGQAEAALSLLEKADAAGFSQAELVRTDEDLASLRGLPRFVAVLESLKRKAEPCRLAPGFQAFQFWVGDWDVDDPGNNLAGRNTVESILNGCAVLESWKGSQGGSGKSVNFYDPETDRWKQTWVDDRGTYTEFVDGVAGDGTLSFKAAPRKLQGVMTWRRLTFTRKGPDEVRQLAEASTDGGKSWTVNYDFSYRRRK